ncbi:MAG: phosphate/phosphite/phosphonate ABC transporter substrate-binding protein [Magnetospirillum sp. WYHS-4]
MTFGVVPQQSATKLAEAWTPFLKKLGEDAGIPLQFRTATDIPTFEKRLAEGEFDFAYMNPYHYTVFHRNPGYQAFAKEKDRMIQGILVVRKDSSIQSVQELTGLTLAFPAPAAFAASVLPRAALTKEGVRFLHKFVSSHDSVYRTVAAGLYPAGGGIVRTFDGMDPEIRDQLRILWRTETYTSHAIAAHPRVPSQVLKVVFQAMSGMGRDPIGSQLLDKLSFKGFEAAVDRDWDDVRALGVILQE